MKRLSNLLMVLGLLLGAVSARADNDIEMLTYFPTPYVAYNNLFLVGDADNPASLDVGLLKGKSFELNLGKDGNTEESSPSLLAQEGALVNLKKGNLGLDLNLYTPTAIFGNTDAASKGNVDMIFNNLRIDTLADAIGEAPKSITAPKVTTSGKVYLFEQHTGDGGKYVSKAALPNCDSTVSWKNLKINGKQGLYLTCGEAPEEPTGPCHLELLNSGNITCNVPAGAHSYCTTIEENPDNALGALEYILSVSKCRIVAGGEVYEWYNDEGSNPNHVFFSPHGGSGASTICTSHFNSSNPPQDGTICIDIGVGKNWANDGLARWPIPICHGGMGPDDLLNKCTPAYHFYPENDCHYISGGTDPWYVNEPLGNGGLEDYQLNAYIAVCE